MADLMKGKKGLIMGLANDRSIAWGIAKMLADHGAELAITYQADALKRRVKPLAEQLNCNLLLECNVSDDESTQNAFATIKDKWGDMDFLVHAIGFSDKNELKGQYINTSRENFLMTMDVSCYSFTAVAKHAAPLMVNGGAMATLTYFGSEEVIPNYNVMGVAKAALEASTRYLAADLGPQKIRVNAISAGPIKTLAASGIGDFRSMLKWNELTTPLGQNVNIEDVGGSALYLLSDLSKSVTGEVHYVDAGYNIMGMPPLANAGALSEVLKEIQS